MPRLTVRADSCGPVDLQAAVEWLRQGRIVALPTDTFYGLAVDPGSAAAAASVFDLKGRGARAALPLIAGSRRQVEHWGGPLTAIGARLADRFWPGPLALIVDAPAAVAAEVHAGLGTVAVRVPAHPVARALCDAWGAPLTATSANRTGEPPAATADALGGIADDPRVMVVVVTGLSAVASGTKWGAKADALATQPSTIVDARGAAPVLVREGAIAWKRVLALL
jgi:L-threonylcarbamoyladenylate synthase